MSHSIALIDCINQNRFSFGRKSPYVDVAPRFIASKKNTPETISRSTLNRFSTVTFAIDRKTLHDQTEEPCRNPAVACAANKDSMELD